MFDDYWEFLQVRFRYVHGGLQHPDVRLLISTAMNANAHECIAVRPWGSSPPCNCDTNQGQFARQNGAVCH